jgi:hypothetical protein
LDFLPGKSIVMEASDALLSSDAGLLPIRQFDERIGLTEQFAGALQETRDPHFTQHSLREMARQRIYGILADYEDQNDHDTLRSDPIFKLLADRSPDGDDLASQPTLSRFENAVSIPDLWRLRDAWIDQFIQSFETVPTRITLDLDAFDDRGTLWVYMVSNNSRCFTATTSSINTCPWRSPARRTISWCWSGCDTAPVRRRWARMTTCGTSPAGSAPSGRTSRFTSAAIAALECP